MAYLRVNPLVMGAWAKAGSSYFAAVFALGFVLGTIRTVWLLTMLGELIAVLLELPVMLAASWWLCAQLIKRFKVPARPAARLAMGALAFALLMAAELFLSLAVMGYTWHEHFAHYATAPGALGLAGQVVFALIPLLQENAVKR